MKTQSGNALFLILIAIFLLGALTALIARTGGNTEETGDTERASIQASDILRYANGVKAGVDLLLSRGCSVSELSFWADSNGDGVENGSDRYYNSGAPTDRSCHVFHTSGVGLTYKKFTEQYFANLITFPTYYYPMFTGRAQVTSIGTECTNATCNELMISVADIKPEVCFAINKQLGIPANTISEQVADWGYFTTEFYDGNFFSAGNTSSYIGNDGGNILNAKKMGCLMRNDISPYNTYEFYAVLVAR